MTVEHDESTQGGAGPSTTPPDLEATLHTTHSTPVSAATAGGPRAELAYSEISDAAQARALISEWVDLADSCAAGPFARHDYALSWWAHLGKGRLLIAVVRRGGELVALAPLHERRVGPIWVARWLGHGLGTVAEILLRPDHEDAATTLWVGLSSRRRVLELVETNAQSPGLSALRARGSLRDKRYDETVRDLCPTTPISGDGLDVLRRSGSTPRRLRRTLSVADRALAAEGSAFTTRVADDRESFERLLPDMRAVFNVAEEDFPRQHFLREPYEAFTLDLLRGTAAKGESAVIVGYIDEVPVSFNVAFLSATTVSLWLSRFDPEAATLSPGHLLTRAVFSWSAESGRELVDQLLGASKAKMQWATDTYETLEITCGHPAALRIASGAVRAAEVAKAGKVRLGRREG